MCQICLIKDPVRFLQEVEKALELGQDPDHFDQALDRVLGTGLSERDPELDAQVQALYHAPGEEN